MITLYAAYDVFPSAKGAATHIQEMVTTLAAQDEELRLLCLRGHDQLPAVQQHDNITIKRYYAEEQLNYLEKATLFSEAIFLEVEQLKSKVSLAHFRDVWSGMGIVAHPNIKTVFEVNALTSIELGYRYPNLTEGFLTKLKHLEQQCLDKTDVVITPSYTTKAFLQTTYHVPEEKISVIPNGAHIPEYFEKPEDTPEHYLIYFGALQPWQGVDILLKAMSYLEDFEHLQLMICSSVKEKAFKPFQKLVAKLGLQDRVILKTQLPKATLYGYIHHAAISIAPLTACDRNIVQGCSPLKILETMACQTVLIASDLPVVRELVSEEEAIFFEPDRELDLARCIRFALDNPEDSQAKVDAALAKMKQEYVWDIQKEKLNAVYDNLKAFA